ncbi:unnamed protein product [Caenorhabditis sp. 36 PRJEB53466]|nr:unnamed protein product [Caenorhabditis sp. 36 PRJEB53466]
MRWPGRVVHYYFDDTKFDPSLKESVLRGMKKISENTCITFSTEPAEMIIRMVTADISNCYAAIGRVQQNQQFVYSQSCFSSGTAMHELIHAIGFLHAHQRLDRDEYLNIEEFDDPEGQYLVYKNQKLIVPYDYGSIMQYSPTDNQMSPKNDDYFYTMGSQIPSFYDYLMINTYYQCSCEQSNLTCLNQGYPNPANCSQCNCPYGFGGADCSQRAEPGITLESSADWKTYIFSLDSRSAKSSDGDEHWQIDFMYYYLWITSPANKTVEVKFPRREGTECEDGCKYGGIEVKTDEDPRMTSPRKCCHRGMKLFKSRNNPTVVMAFNSKGIDEYTVAYRYTD